MLAAFLGEANLILVPKYAIETHFLIFYATAKALLLLAVHVMCVACFELSNGST